MTETEISTHQAGKQQNTDAMPETSELDDAFDETYKDKEGPKPPMVVVWRNVMLMFLLHMGALYGLILIPSASALTLAWGKYLVNSVAGLTVQHFLDFLFLSLPAGHSQRTECVGDHSKLQHIQPEG